MAEQGRARARTQHGNLGESEHPTTIGVGHIGETPETELPVGGGAHTIRIDEKVSEIAAGEPGLWTTSPPGGVSASEEEEESVEEAAP